MILYKMIVDAGLLLQLDDVRNATAFGDLKDLRRWLSRYRQHAIEDLPADRVRYHVCWGSWLAGVEDRQARARADADPGRHQP